MNKLAEQTPVGESNRSYSRKLIKGKSLNKYYNKVGVGLLEKVRKEKNMKELDKVSKKQAFAKILKDKQR
jgi:hypothetical protein